MMMILLFRLLRGGGGSRGSGLQGLGNQLSCHADLDKNMFHKRFEAVIGV